MAGSVYPILRYADARAAIEFLTTAFGFEAKDVTEDDEGGVVHAELTHGDGLIMLSRLDHARITQPLTDQPYGSREYGALDPEGNRWYIGTYRP
jgi:uncharacterized glyoxalase superfamily protein PhnB